MNKTVIYDSSYFARQEKLKQALKQGQKENLKIPPCPCCGGKSLHYDNFERNTIQCSKCGLTTPTKNSLDSCLKIWNERCGTDVEEVVMGEWKRVCGDNKFVCSECGRLKPKFKALSNYCGHCGADMRGVG